MCVLYKLSNTEVFPSNDDRSPAKCTADAITEQLFVIFNCKKPTLLDALYLSDHVRNLLLARTHRLVKVPPVAERTIPRPPFLPQKCPCRSHANPVTTEDLLRTRQIDFYLADDIRATAVHFICPRFENTACNHVGQWGAWYQILADKKTPDRHCLYSGRRSLLFTED